MKKILTVICALCLTALAASAQKGWFIDASLGSNFNANANGFSGSGIGAQGGFGYMFNEAIGLRATAQLGIGNATPDAGAGNAWFISGRHIRGAVAGDVLWDIIGTFYDGDGCYRILPYFRLQETFGTKRGTTAFSFGFGGGIRQVFYFVPSDKSFGVIVDVNAVGASEKPWYGGKGLMCLAQATVGLVYHF